MNKLIKVLEDGGFDVCEYHMDKLLKVILEKIPEKIPDTNNCGICNSVKSKLCGEVSCQDILDSYNLSIDETTQAIKELFGGE